MYFYVVDFKQATDGNLRPVVIGGRAFTSHIKAQSYMDDALLSNRAEIIEVSSPTRSVATREIKAKLVRRYGRQGRGQWQKGLKRAIHQEDI